MRIEHHPQGRSRPPIRNFLPAQHPRCNRRPQSTSSRRFRPFDPAARPSTARPGPTTRRNPDHHSRHRRALRRRCPLRGIPPDGWRRGEVDRLLHSRAHLALSPTPSPDFDPNIRPPPPARGPLRWARHRRPSHNTTAMAFFLHTKAGKTRRRIRSTIYKSSAGPSLRGGDPQVGAPSILCLPHSHRWIGVRLPRGACGGSGPTGGLRTRRGRPDHPPPSLSPPSPLRHYKIPTSRGALPLCSLLLPLWHHEMPFLPRPAERAGEGG